MGHAQEGVVVRELRRGNRNALTISALLLAYGLASTIYMTLTQQVSTLELLGFIVVLAPVAVWCHRSVLRAHDPFLHPHLSALARFGSAPSAVLDIERDLVTTCKTLRLRRWTLFVGHHWLLLPRFFGIIVLATSEIVWLYERRTTHYALLLLPVTRYHDLVICTADGRMCDYSCFEDQAPRALELLASVAPWAEVGFETALASKWAAARHDLIATVQHRQRVMNSDA